MNAPKAFFSYVRHVDQHEGGRLTHLRERLQGEIRVQTHLNVDIFQDIASIRWGDRWKRQLIESLSEAYFLIPIITPGYFVSDACREEYELFKRRQARLESVEAGVILPVYYVETDEMNDPTWRAGNEWATEVHAHQWADWRPVRLEAWDSPAEKRVIEKMARDFKDRLKAMGILRPGSGVSPVDPPPGPAGRRGEAHPPEIREANADTSAPVDAAEPLPRRRELVVDASGREQFTTISDAIRAARTDEIVLVRPGTYREGIVLDKSLTLIGDGPRDAIVVEARRRDTLKCTAPFGRVTNITLRQAGGGEWFCVHIRAGLIELEHCDLTSESGTCLAVSGNADPTVRRNRIHDGEKAGVLVYGNGRGTFEDNDIFANGYSGFMVKEGGDPTVRRNRIHDGKQNGILVFNTGRGTFEDNDIFANAYSGIEVKQRGDPTVRRNRIRDGNHDGIYVHDHGRGTFEDNDIGMNTGSGMKVNGGGDPVTRGNRVTGNGDGGIWVYEGGRGTFVDNDLRGNKRGAWEVAADSLPLIKRQGNIER